MPKMRKPYKSTSDLLKGKVYQEAPQAKSWKEKRRKVRIKPVKKYIRQYGDPGYRPADGSKTGN